VLRPSKHNAPEQTVLWTGALLLDLLRTRRTVDFGALRESLRAKAPNNDALFVPALSLLYLLGRVEYHAATDSLEYRRIRP
jgi:hypothetical protein